VKAWVSETAEVAKLSSSSISSTISSGIAIAGRSTGSGSSMGRGSWTKNLRSDSGEMSRDRLPSDLMLRSSHDWRSSVTSDDELGFRLKSLRGEKLQPEPGERDLADRLWLRRRGALPILRKVVDDSEGTGAGRGVANLSAGFMVL